MLIDNHITVTVLEARGDKIRLGFSAPKNVVIHREEVMRRIAAEAVETGIIAQGEEKLDYLENQP